MPFDQIREDLDFLQRQPKPPTVAWYDPNFGIRFDDYMDIIESVVPPGRMAFGGESSLSVLSEPNLKRMKKNNFIVMLPGIESWFDFNGKSKQQKNVGMAKVEAVAEQVNRVLRYIPYVQTNLIFGLDGDAGELPFELTKKYVDLAPGVYPNFAMLTSFGNSAPLSRQYQAEGRVIDIPFPFLDGNAGLNVRLKNYDFVEFYDHYIDLVKYSYSPKKIWRRFQANKHPLPRWMNLLRATFSGKGKRGNYFEIRDRLVKEKAFRDFYLGESPRPPSYYLEQTKLNLGEFFPLLPKRVHHYLTEGEPAPNPRISNALQPQEAPAGEGGVTEKRPPANASQPDTSEGQYL